MSNPNNNPVDADLVASAAQCFARARGNQANSQGSLEDAVTSFVQTYWTAASSIVSVGQGNNCIRVVVQSPAAANQLPTTHEGYHVAVVQGTGNLEKQGGSGDKAIVRDANGQVIGMQG